MKLILSLSSIFILSVLCFGQKSVADLKPSHATALEQFLSKNKEYQFLSSKVIDAEYMKFIRKSFGKTFEPYYQVGDFNHDKIVDFAIILSRKGERKENGEPLKSINTISAGSRDIQRKQKRNFHKSVC
jgi:hypothetical protein